MKYWLSLLPMLAASCSFSDVPKVSDKSAFIGCYGDGRSVIKITPSDVEVGGDHFAYSIEERTIGPILNMNVVFESGRTGELKALAASENLYRFQGIGDDLTIIVPDNNSVVHKLSRLDYCP